MVLTPVVTVSSLQDDILVLFDLTVQVHVAVEIGFESLVSWRLPRLYLR